MTQFITIFPVSAVGAWRLRLAYGEAEVFRLVVATPLLDNTAFTELTERTVVLERYFTPYHSSTAVQGDRIAILAPHPDDEVFGCGASACKWAQQGRVVQAFVLTAGVVEGEFGDDAAARDKRLAKATQRANESKAAAQVLGVAEPVFMGAQDGALWDDETIEAQLLAQLVEFAPTTLVAPSIWEMHRDHRTTAEMAIRLGQRLSSVKHITFYEVGVPLTPNVLEDTTAYQVRKQQAMHCFPSQLAGQHYAQQMTGLNTFRSYTLGLEVLFAEAFYCLPKAEAAAFEAAHAVTQTTLTLKAAEQQSHDQMTTIHRLQQHAHEQSVRIVALEQMLHQTHQSLSWRWTQPIRWLRRKLRR